MQILHTLSRPISSVAFSPDCRWLAVGEGVTTTFLFSLPSFTRHREWKLLNCQSTCFSPDSRFLVASHFAVQIVDLTRKTLKQLLPPPYLVGKAEFRPGRRELIARDVESIHRWAFPSGRTIAPRWRPQPVNSTQTLYPKALCCHPDGQQAAIIFRDRMVDHVVLWEIDTVRIVRQSAAPLAGVASFARYSPDGSLLATLHGPAFRLWDSELTEIAHREPGRKNITGLAFAADGQRLATVGEDGLVRVWQAPQWEQVQTFDWEIGGLTCVDASSDGCLFAAGSDSGKVMVWDAG